MRWVVLNRGEREGSFRFCGNQRDYVRLVELTKDEGGREGLCAVACRELEMGWEWDGGWKDTGVTIIYKKTGCVNCGVFLLRCPFLSLSFPSSLSPAAARARSLD